MKKYGKEDGSPFSLGLLIITLLLILAAFLPAIIILGPDLLDSLKGQEPPEQNQTAPLSPDEQLYYELKKTSCRTLSKNFLIETIDRSEGSLYGLLAALPEEYDAALRIAAENDLEQTTRTYVRGDQMKKVYIVGNQTYATIWKEGRIYQCAPSCSMRLLGDAGWQSYLDMLSEMRSDCAHFGRTELPDSVNKSRLLSIRKTGRKLINGFQCEGFAIYGNRAYASFLLNSTELDTDQRALVWAVAHMEGPATECLDDGIGLIVHRNITLDLTDSYRFEYQPGGYMRLNQETYLKYYSDNVPESFLALPG